MIMPPQDILSGMGGTEKGGAKKLSVFLKKFSDPP